MAQLSPGPFSFSFDLQGRALRPHTPHVPGWRAEGYPRLPVTHLWPRGTLGREGAAHHVLHPPWNDGGRPGYPVSSALANYCDVPPLLIPFLKGSPVPAPPPSLRPGPGACPSHPPSLLLSLSLMCLLESSDHSNYFGDLIMYIDNCKL